MTVSAATAAVVGRFAPSPTGPLHFGSLVAALGSYLEARTQGGRWLVRIEDVDVPRASPSVADGLLRSLERLGFTWDGPVVRQSQRSAYYREALANLQTRHLAYPCACTRRTLALWADAAMHTKKGAGAGLMGRDQGTIPYPGLCRNGLPPGKMARAWRLRVDAAPSIGFDDALQGRICEILDQVTGDFVLLRADGCFAYQLAVVVDDAAQNVSEVVRGADLIGSTPRQIWLQRCLGLNTPRYVHVPIAVDMHGNKLSKQTGAAPIDAWPASQALSAALTFLGHTPPPDLTLAALWDWAFAHWSLARVPRVLALTAPNGY